MNESFQKLWIYLLGTVFILCSFIYLLKYSLDQGWLSSEVKIGIGLVFGAGCVLWGIKWLSKLPLAGEMIAGLGAAFLYTTFSFAGIYYALWEPVVVFICTIALTIGLGLLASRQRLRLLMNISLLGGLLSPWMLRPETDQVFTLFLYLLVLNAVFFAISLKHHWTELRLISFIGTWMLYAAYYVQFDPELGHIWSLPFRYALAAYVFYIFAFLMSSWKHDLRFDGLNLYMGFVNAVIFAIWAMVIWEGIVPYAYPLLLMGMVYVILAIVIQRLIRSFQSPVWTNLFGGMLLILISASQFGQHLPIKPLINVYFWLIVALLLLAAGTLKSMEGLKAGAAGLWLIIVCYWFTVTWDTPRGIWFGVYVPFLNWAALAWELLAAVGFYFSLRLSFRLLTRDGNRLLAYASSILSHLIVGGLLTVQVRNMISEYDLWKWLDLQLTLSISWGIYALLLFLWGAYSRQSVFRVFGSCVLIMVAFKTLLFDLSGSETIYRVIVLFLLGVITFAIAYVNGKWRQPNPIPSGAANESDEAHAEPQARENESP